MFVDPEKPHLGGFQTGPLGDEATYFPALWTYLVNDLKIESVLDVGCGSGASTRFFEALLPGAVAGIDGILQPANNIHQHDYTTGPFLHQKPHDLVWCCECVEHIEEKFLPNLLETFKCGRYVLMTHAFPGQAGHNHVNCKTPSYWIGCLAAIGYRLDEQLTELTRAISTKNTNEYNHFLRSGMCFVRN